jgi:hypothetical protein
VGLYSLPLSLVSCEDEIVNSEEQLTTYSKEGANEEKCDFEVHGVYIENGVPQNSDNNMLHFPSW